MIENTALETCILRALYDSLQLQYGLLLRTNNSRRLRDIIIRIKQDTGDKELDALSIRFSASNPDNEVLIVKKSEEKDVFIEF